jgi:hypothetical protein
MTLLSAQKVLTANDLGLTGTHQSGILIPKDPATLSLFPRLDEAQYNPDTRISVLSPQTGEHWELRFVHYNNRVHGQGTRDEYRVTGTAKLLRALGASVGDILRISRTAVGDIEIRVEPAPRGHHLDGDPITLSNGWSVVLSEPGDRT